MTYRFEYFLFNTNHSISTYPGDAINAANIPILIKGLCCPKFRMKSRTQKRAIVKQKLDGTSFKKKLNWPFFLIDSHSSLEIT